MSKNNLKGVPVPLLPTPDDAKLQIVLDTMRTEYADSKARFRDANSRNIAILSLGVAILSLFMSNRHF